MGLNTKSKFNALDYFYSTIKQVYLFIYVGVRCNFLAASSYFLSLLLPIDFNIATDLDLYLATVFLWIMPFDTY